MATIAPKAFYAALRERGFDFFTGVPCSLIKPLLATLEQQREVPYLPATREDSALGVAAGAAMAGKRPVVLMQNSGLGVSLNALVSLHAIYELPCLLLVTWRGFAGKDAPEHVVLGPKTPRLLSMFEIPTETLGTQDAGSWERKLSWADIHLRKLNTPVALLVHKGVF